MAFLIKLDGTDYEFYAEPGEKILDAAQRSGLILKSACRSGACGACKAQVLSGEVELGKYLPSALPDADRAAGLTLLCTAKPLSDLVLKVREVKRAEKKPEHTLAVIAEKKLLCPSIMRLTLESTGDAFEYKAGQTYAVELPGGIRRVYSIAVPEGNKAKIEFLIRKVTGGLFSGMLFSDGLRVGDALRLSGPDGDFTFKTPKGRKAIFLATGTGIAPVKSIVETLIQKNDLEGRKLHIFWGVRTAEELVLGPLFEGWAAQYPQIRYTPVVSRDETWGGAKGHIQTFAAQHHGDMTETDAYLCGSDAMINAAVNFLSVRCGLKDDHIFSDNFGI